MKPDTIRYCSSTINTPSEVNTEDLSHENLRPMFRTGDSYLVNEKDWCYRSGVMTALGDIEILAWIELCKKLMEREEELAMFEQISEWFEENSTEKESQDKGFDIYECYIKLLPNDRRWDDYIRFNERYRPELITQDTELVSVVTECCNTPCKVTFEQIKACYGEPPQVPCPVCGKVSHFVHI